MNPKELFSQVLEELNYFFYYNQYDEEKYPHFRALDLIDGVFYCSE